MRWLVVVVVAAGGLSAQSAAPPGLRFEVASVLQNRKANCQGRWDFSAAHGAVAAQNAPLLRIISRAYGLADDRVSGPAWLESECYDILAKTSGEAADRDLMAMLRTLLEERFHLAAHMEAAEMPVLALVVDGAKSKLPAYGDHVPTPNSGGRILFIARHMPDLCERIAKVTARAVIDRTGLNGDYLIVLSYRAFGASNGDASDPTSEIAAAVRDQLGLRLEAQRGVVDTLKIDRVDKVPTAN